MFPAWKGRKEAGIGNGATVLIFEGASEAVKGLRSHFVRWGRGEGREAWGHLSSWNLKALCKARNSPFYG